MKYEDAVNTVRKREEKLNKAIKSLGNNAYAIKHSYEEYIKEEHSIIKTGELCDKVESLIDNAEAAEDAESLNDFLFILDKLNIKTPRCRYKLNKFKEYLNTIKY